MTYDDENSDEEWEDEPVELNCEICDFSGTIEEMVDCPRYEIDVGRKGTMPGWIHEYHCEEEFADYPEGCIGCDSVDISQLVIKNFEKCVDLEGLEKNESDITIFMDQHKVFGITAQMENYLEKLKPLNIVVSKLEDRENDILYIKDNKKNILVYTLSLYEKAKDRFSKFYLYSPEEFCKPNGPLILVYRLGDASIGAIIAPRIMDDNLTEVGIEVAKNFKRKYIEAEEFFGVAVEPHKEELREIIQRFSEDELIRVVLCPLLESLGFKGVKAISFHGPGERGGDFHPFYKSNEFGKLVYYSAQAKAVKIHSKAGCKEGNVNQLIDQMKKLFRTSFKSFIDNIQKKISQAFIFCSQDITSEARDQLFSEFENRQQISLLDIDDIVGSILQCGISEEIIEYYRKKGNKGKKRK